MQRTDAMALARHFNIPPTHIIESQARTCSNKVAVQDALAVETTINGEPSMAFLCSDACYIAIISPEHCWRA
jgi:hypothetical protein